MLRYAVLVFLGACSYGILSTFVKLSYRLGFSLQEVVGSQVLFGFLMLWSVALFVPKIKLAWRERLLLMAVGSTIGLTGMLYYGALRYLDASLAVILLFQFTWIGVILESMLRRKRPEKEKVYALVLLPGGTFLAGNGLEVHFSQWSPIGVLLGFGAALSYSAFIIFSGRAVNRLHPLSRSTVMAAGSLILVFAVFPPSFIWNGSLLHGLWLWGGLIALFGVAIPTLLFTIGVPHIGGGMATILSSAELPMAVLMSAIVLKETISGLQWIGVILILTGIVLPEVIHFSTKREKGLK